MKDRLLDDSSSGSSGADDGEGDRDSASVTSARDRDENGSSCEVAGSSPPERRGEPEPPPSDADSARDSRVPSEESLCSIAEREGSDSGKDDDDIASQEPSSPLAEVAAQGATAPSAATAAGVPDEGEPLSREARSSSSETVDVGVPRGGVKERYAEDSNRAEMGSSGFLDTNGGVSPSVAAPSPLPGSEEMPGNPSAGAATTGISADNGLRTSLGSVPAAATGAAGARLRVTEEEKRRPSRRASLISIAQMVKRRSSALLGARASPFKGRHSGKVGQNMHVEQ